MGEMSVTIRLAMTSERTVLVVDDDSDVRGSCADVLRTAGYRVIEAEDSSAAREHLRSPDINAVLLDIYMPGLDGLALLDELDDPPPVALLTAHVYDEEVVARRSKVALYIQKPVAPMDLLEVVGRMISPVSDILTGGIRTWKGV